MFFFLKLKGFLLLILVFCVSLSLSAQEKHFIYLQTESNQPFYVKMNNNILSSSSAGYIILPKLQKGTQTFFIGFPKSTRPEQKFEVNVEDANKGYLIKNFDENGYALFDLQSLALVKNTGSDVVVTKPAEAAKDNNAFSQLLANVVHDSTILQNNKLPEAKVVKNDTIASSGQSQIIVANSSQPQIVVNNDSVESSSQPQSMEKNETPVTPVPVIAKPAATTKKILGAKEAGGMDMIYVDINNGKTDTIRLFLAGTAKDAAPLSAMEAAPKAVVIYEPEKKATTDTTLTITPTIVKAPEKNIYIKESSKKADDSAQVQNSISQPQATVVLRSEETSTVKENNATTKKDSSIEIVRISENSDCKAFATDNDFLKLRKKMAAETNTDEMINAAKKYFKSRCFTTEQIKNLSFLFLDDEGKYKFFDAAYPFTSDSSQYSSLQEQLKDEYYVNRFKAMIHK